VVVVKEASVRRKNRWILDGLKEEVAKFEAFDKKVEQSLRVSEESLNRLIKI